MTRGVRHGADVAYRGVVPSLADWAVSVIEAIGELGVGVLIALETVVPPIPSEVVLPFAGFAAAQGSIDPYLAWLAATAGSLVGAWFLYWLGDRYGYDRLHRLAGRKRFVFFGQRDLERGHAFFTRHGTAVVLVARFIPFLRSVVSVPAGLERMPLVRFSLLTGLGSGIWNAAFIAIGYRLGDDYALVERWVGPVATVVLVGCALGMVVLAVRRRREADAEDAQDSSRQERQSAL